MNTNKKTARSADISPRKAVTSLRFLYLLWFVIGPFSLMYVPTTLIVSGDAAATANNIMANEWLFRMGIAGSLITQIIQILVVLVLYKLLKPVSKNYASLMVAFALVGIPMAMLNTLNQVAALILLNGADFLKVLGTDQLHIQMMFFLDLYKQGVFIPTIFWGLWLFPFSYLIYKSGYFPKILGVLVMMGCIGYLLDSFTHILLSNYADYEAILDPVILLLTLGELPFMIWFLIKGVNVKQWKKRALESA